MSKIKSLYLKTEVEVAYNKTEVNGAPTTIITHDSLEDVILNQVPQELGVKYDKTVEYVAPGHSVVKCTISDKNGRRVQCLGESVEATLYTEISKGIPTLMAEIRAFDRAAIRYLALPGKVYSNEEGVQPDHIASDRAGNKSGNTVIDPSDYMEDMESSVEDEMVDESGTIVSTVVPTEESTPAPSEKAKAETTPEKKDRTKDAGAIIVNFGKFKNAPKTVAEICEDEGEKQWVEFVLNKINTDDAEKKKQLTAMRYYLEHKGA